ncbi:hypothetical protein LWI29_029480 [Acer saccharum]|uniref:Uncharacterized protein n=1 Tax=Acer saccharum TaxID=4024 RepID=A0AA39S007_ACESA|nr:hypothetical protein LWI29_029480 [Acer saccharum]
MLLYLAVVPPPMVGNVPPLIVGSDVLHLTSCSSDVHVLGIGGSIRGGTVGVGGDELDLRTNPFQEEGNDEDVASTRSWNVDPIQVPIGPVTRARARKFQNALSGLIQGIWAQASTWRPIEGDELDLRTNPFQEEGNDEDVASTRSWNVDPIQVPIGPVTRARARKFQNALSGLIQGIWAQASTWRPIEGDERNLQPITNMIQVQESQ